MFAGHIDQCLETDDVDGLGSFGSDQIHYSRNRIILIGLQEDLRGLSGADQSHVGLIDVGPHSHPIHVADGHQHGARQVGGTGNHHFTLLHVAINDGAIHGRTDFGPLEVLLTVPPDAVTLGQLMLAHRQRRPCLFQGRLDIPQFRFGGKTKLFQVLKPFGLGFRLMQISLGRLDRGL